LGLDVELNAREKLLREIDENKADTCSRVFVPLEVKKILAGCFNPVL